MPLLPIVVGSILGLLVIAMIAYMVYLSRPQPSQNPTVAGIPCDQLEHTQVHYHTVLQIIYNGVVTNIPQNTGIEQDSSGNSTCFYWLHIHSQDPNVIHVESPAANTFTLGQFFAVWSSWSQQHGDGARKLDATHVATFTVGPDQKIVTYVDLDDGKGPQVYNGDPSAIQLKSHETITIEITPPDVNPPPTINWTQAPYSGL